MPLVATDFLTQGPTSTPESQLYNLLTGGIKDQPVTLSDTLSVGGWQSAGGSAMQVYGGIDVYATRQDAAPGFRIGPGGFTWPSVAVLPSATVDGDLTVTGTIHGTLAGLNALITSYLPQLRPGVTALPGLALGGADPWSAGIAVANLVVRAGDLASLGTSVLASFECWSGNWLQFNVRVQDTNPSLGWQGKRLTLDFDADTQTSGSGGRIEMMAGKVGIGSIPDVEGAILNIQQRLAARGI